MKITRLVELSLVHIIKERFSIKRTNDKAKASADFKAFMVKYNSIQTNKDVVVKVNDGVVNTGYTVDYVNGLIVFSAPLTASDTVKVDYEYCPLNIYDEGSSPDDDNFRYPAVAIYTDGDRRYPYELGSSDLKIRANWIVTVMTEDGGARQDITDDIMDIFKEEIAIIDFNQGFPFDREGHKNDSFDVDAQRIGYMTCESINSDKGGSLDIGNKPKYLSDIFVELEINI